jgi:hypothetical protein
MNLLRRNKIYGQWSETGIMAIDEPKLFFTAVRKLDFDHAVH